MSKIYIIPCNVPTLNCSFFQRYFLCNWIAQKCTRCFSSPEFWEIYVSMDTADWSFLKVTEPGTYINKPGKSLPPPVFAPILRTICMRRSYDSCNSLTRTRVINNPEMCLPPPFFASTVSYFLKPPDLRKHTWNSSEILFTLIFMCISLGCTLLCSCACRWSVSPPCVSVSYDRGATSGYYFSSGWGPFRGFVLPTACL